MSRVVYAITMALLAILLPLQGAQAASFINLIPPADTDGDSGSGSSGTPTAFVPTIGPPGLVFEVQRDFSISAASVALGVDGVVRSTVQISRFGIGGAIHDARAVTADVRGIDPFLPRVEAGLGPLLPYYWFDIPIEYSFVAGQTYQLAFPFWDYEIVSGVPSDSGNWLFIQPRFFDVEGRAPTDPYSVDQVLTVVDGTLKGTRITGLPLSGLVADIGDTDPFSRDLNVAPIPLPASLPLFAMAVGLIAVISRRKRSQVD